MFTAISINATAARRQLTSALAVDSGLLMPQRATDEYPSPMILGTICRQYDPDLFFLDLDNPSAATACLREIQVRCPLTPVIGFGGTPVQQSSFAEAGISHFLSFPPDPVMFQDQVARAIRRQDGKPVDNLFAFLPAKAGAGASTAAFYTAAAISAHLKRRTLCLDADLHSGVLSAKAGCTPVGTTQHALESADELDSLRWHNFVTRHQGMDLLLASEEQGQGEASWSTYYRLIQFVRSRYEAIVVDLPQMLDDATQEVVRRAGTVCLVATQEPISLQLAQRRLAELEDRGIGEDRIRVIITRWRRYEMRLGDIERALGLPVAARIPDNYRALRSAEYSGELALSRGSQAGEAFLKLGESLLSGTPLVEQEPAPLWASLRRLLAIGA
jgi:pilus assembly protein CpaE